MIGTAREWNIDSVRQPIGGGNWSSQTTTSYHGGDAAQTGSIGANGQSWMQTTVSGPGIIRFYWKVSSQLGGDYLEFFIDSVRQARISGTTDWLGQSYTITGSGTHTLKWRYTKNASGTGGSDCAWVDYVQSPSPTDWLTITYGYDSAGRRIEKAYDGQTVVKYLCDGSHIIAEYDGSGGLLHKYIYGPGVDQPICMIDVANSNAAYYYHFDGLGSVIGLTNSAGSVANLYEYSVFGEVSASDPNHPNRFLFTGREFDADTGLYYYRARYYNPYIGRFLQTDPAGDGMNAYAYCGNDPVGFTDPSGLISQWIYNPPAGPKKVAYAWPPATLDPKMTEDPSATSVRPWQQKHFDWWYINMGGLPVDLFGNGLTGDGGAGFGGGLLANVGRLKYYVTTYIKRAKEAAQKRWQSLNAASLAVEAAWEAHRQEGKLGIPCSHSLEELTMPLGTVTFDYTEETRDVDFGAFSLYPILGNMELTMNAAITVSRGRDWIKEEILAGAMIKFNFELSGWYRNRWKGWNPGTFPLSGWEYDNGYPYRTIGTWDAVEHVLFGPQGSWGWKVYLPWEQFARYHEF